MRLDKFLSKAAGLSRNEAKKVLHRGEITVNDDVIKDAKFHVKQSDTVLWAEEPLEVAHDFRYLLLYKPEGFECTLKPKEYPIVTELLYLPELDALRIAGRLDVDTTGALILSDDGAFLHRVTSPKKKQPKEYHLTLAEPMNAAAQTAAIHQINNGILLEGDLEKTAPAELEFLDETHAILTLTEGKYHQVKRMMGYFGNRVTALHRARIGTITLDGLETGESRYLTAQEIAQFG